MLFVLNDEHCSVRKLNYKNERKTFNETIEKNVDELQTEALLPSVIVESWHCLMKTHFA